MKIPLGDVRSVTLICTMCATGHVRTTVNNTYVLLCTRPARASNAELHISGHIGRYQKFELSGHLGQTPPTGFWAPTPLRPLCCRINTRTNTLGKKCLIVAFQQWYRTKSGSRPFAGSRAPWESSFLAPPFFGLPFQTPTTKPQKQSVRTVPNLSLLRETKGYLSSSHKILFFPYV